MSIAEMEEQRRIEAGLPPRRCLNCRAVGRHWVPESLTDPGHYICETKEEVSEWSGSR